MRKYTLSAGKLLAIFCLPVSVPAMAQDETGQASEAPEPPASLPQLTPDQQVIFDDWSPEQQSSYAAWPGDVQAYYWSLPVPRQEMFWRLTDNDKVALAKMEPVDQAAAWELVEKRLQDDAGTPPKTSDEMPAGS